MSEVLVAVSYHQDSSAEEVATKTLTKKEQKASDKAAKKKDKDEKRSSEGKKAKKNMAGKMATSKLGGKAFKKFADDETVELLDLIQRQRKCDRYQGEYYEDRCEDYFITPRQRIDGRSVYRCFVYLTADIIGRFKKMCSLVKNAYRTNLMNGLKGEIEEKQVARLGEIAHEIDELTKGLLSPHLSSNTTNRLSEIIAYFANESFLKFAFADKEFDRVVVILTYYLEQM